MMNTTTLFAASLLSFVLLGAAVAAPGRATLASKDPVATYTVQDVTRPIPAPEAILVASEVVVVGGSTVKAKTFKAPKTQPVKRPELQKVCHVEVLQQGSGTVKVCEWK